MNGILLVDKPAGMTSHTVVSKLRKKLNTKKIGHAGTLDPSATGLLAVCVGQATKISSYVMDGDKTYQTKFEFGKVTTTYDTEGKITSTADASCISRNQILETLPRFTGDILQTPPMYSAIKIQGKKLYQYARANEEIEIEPRPVRIENLKLNSFDPPFAELEIDCSKGTYVRSIVHDLGQALNVGASVISIHRLRSSPFSLNQAVSLSVLLEMDIEKIQQCMISIQDALKSKFEIIEVSDEQEVAIRQGKEMPKSITSKEMASDQLILFVSKSSGQETAIARWETRGYFVPSCFLEQLL
ncbi:MAG: tRNA pseudouridine(55) synthase TruB [Bdellovibrionota bacterium]